MPQTHKATHIPILDGWRALSILLVLAGHWLPLGLASWQINASVAASGMALFFCLSGFLITQFLHVDPRVGVFLIKRIFRVVPLAWAAMTILVVANKVTFKTAIANFLFFANLPPSQLMPGGEHLWSLFVEMQFYIFMAIVALLGGRKGLFLIPVFTVCITLLRIQAGEIISIVTWHRADEIFIGGCVSLAWNNAKIERFARRLSPLASPLLLVCLIGISLPQAATFGYLRPYIAGATIFASLYAFPPPWYQVWTCKTARYIARISYAVYVVHGMLSATPLGGHGVSKIERYILRVPLALLTWAISHLSTFYYERAAIALGHRLINRADSDSHRPS